MRGDQRRPEQKNGIWPGPGGEAASGKRAPRKYLLLRLWRYLGRYYALIGMGLALMIVSIVLSVLGPMISG